MAELIINGREALKEWGVRMGDNFLDVLGAPVPLKEFIENKSRLEHGKQVLMDNPKLDERELTLVFTVEGDSPADYQAKTASFLDTWHFLPDYQAKKTAFYEELYKGKIDIQIPENSSDIYHLLYLGKSVSYAQSLDRTFGKISAKFCEYNPSNRVVG